MNLNLKGYKLLKIKLLLQNNSLILIFNKLNSKTESIKSKNYKSYFIRTKLMKKILRKSILCNLNPLINGMLILIVLKNNNLNLNIISKLKTQELFSGVKLNNKLYSAKQLCNLNTFNYNTNIKNLHSLLNVCLMFNSLKLKKISK